MIGADICGFVDNTTIPLCARWSALGAFYPFSRNHNSLGNIDQDPVALGPIVTKAAKDSLELRYQLLPVLYTLFYKAHIFGDTVFRPLFFVFPKDEVARTVDTQFLWGDSLMFIPTLEENATSVNGYIPAGPWFRYPDLTPIKSNQSSYIEFDSPLTAPPVILLRGGKIIVTQESRLTTTESRKTNFTLIVALDKNENAEGDLYWDDGESLNPKYNLIKFTAKTVRY
jgi:lysosomal alpha-glucosidase